MLIIFSMILSGNGLFILYLIVTRLTRDLLSNTEKYLLLKISVIFSIFPFAYAVEKLKVLNDLYVRRYFPGQITIENDSHVLLLTENGIYSDHFNTYKESIFLVWISITLLVFLRYLIRHLKVREFVMVSTYEIEDEALCERLGIMRRRLRIRRNVRIRMTDVPASPFTIGIVHPIIVISNLVNEQNMDDVLLHELWHIKKYDAVFRMLQILMTGVYWFHPLVYVLNRHLECACELACDESVIRDMAKEERRRYGMAIISAAELDGTYSAMNVTSFNNKNYLKERIYHIMRGNVKSKKLAVILSMGMVLCSSIPVLACPETSSVRMSSMTKEVLLEGNGSRDMAFLETEGLPGEFVIYENQFIGSNGEVYNLDAPVEYKKCDKHTFLIGNITKHNKYDDGSCLYKIYEGKRCLSCGYLEIGDLISTHEYVKCPH